jgi:23S rRNA (uracil1939-C5)-methyltransferase
MAPKNIIYVSCDPDSFARDLKILEEGSFAIRKIQPVDMFPQTRHIELLAFLSYTGESV